MVFDATTYSVLIVSSSEKMTSQLRTFLASLSCYPIADVSSISAAKREIAERTYDFVIINAPLAEGTGYRFAIDACENKSTISLMMLKSDIYDDVDLKVSCNGVFTLQKPVSSQIFSLSISWMKAARERLRSLEKKSATLEDRMEEIRIANRAKWVLIEKEGMSEDEAHKYIERKAMNTGSTKTEIAKQIIENN